MQLFRTDLVDAIDFTRIEGAGGDGGVEAFAILPNDRKIGLQAKYFDKLTLAQWSQISKSVKATLKNHPDLREYRIAVPLDRTPKQKTKWVQCVKEWQLLAKQSGFRRTIKFIWWGSSELLDLLTLPSHSAKQLYWFGCRMFTDEWLDRQNQSTIADLDCRYTPNTHVQTESEKLLNAFSLRDSFTCDYFHRVSELFDAARKLEEAAKSDNMKQAVPEEITLFSDAFHKTGDSFNDQKRVPAFAQVREALVILEAAWEKLTCRLETLNRPKKPFKSYEEQAFYKGPFDWPLSLTTRFERKLRNLEGFLTRYRCADNRQSFVVGNAGSGKSHLLTKAVQLARERGQTALLLLGEHFLTGDDPWTQLLRKICWDGDVSGFLSCLNQAAVISGYPALICIDALNESPERSLWRSHLNGFAKQIEPFLGIRLLVSCRSDFVPLTLPDSLAKGTDESWIEIEHTGYGDQLFDAVTMYFSSYGILSHHFPPLLEEFQNPLFLKTFCEAFENSHLPSGPISLGMVMDRRISKLCEKLLKDIDCPKDVTLRAIELIATAIQSNQGQAVPLDEIRPQIESIFPGRGESKSLYRHLNSNGLLVEVGIGYSKIDSETQVAVRFPYERYSDYFIAEKMLRPFRTAAEFKSACSDDGMFSRINDHFEFYKIRGLMRVLAIILPERFGVELADLVQNRRLFREVHEDFLQSLPWRSPKSFGKSSRELLRKSQRLGLGQFIQALLRVSTIPEHPYNADFLHSRLKPMLLKTRDEVWTIEVSNLTVRYSSNVPDQLLKWAFRVQPHLVSDQQALLVARMLAWFFSSNHKGFRSRATLAAIRILNGRCKITAQLVRDFHDINDPYVVERVHAVACGVAMREQKVTELQLLAQTEYDTVFSGNGVPAHILLRDYARCVIELAFYRGCHCPDINLLNVRPPYRSKWPRIWSEGEIKTLEKTAGWSAITSSIQPECTRMYGDFGRYVMQSHVHQFSNTRIKRKIDKNQGKKPFDALMARRWILQRVKRLGWSPERFENYESDLPFRGRQRADIEESRLERISKKYQWIALHELEAYLSDHFHRAIGWEEEEPTGFQGTWELYARDFDPSQPLREPLTEDESDQDAPTIVQTPFWKKYPDPFADSQIVADREAWVIAKPNDFKELIQLSQVPNCTGDFLALAGHYSWEENLPHLKIERDCGRLVMWVHIKSWLVSREHLDGFLKLLKVQHFYGFGCEHVPIRRGWLGEYPWGDAHRKLRSWAEEQDEWLKGIQISATQTVCSYENKVGGFCPSPKLCETLNARWSGKDFEFVDESGTVVAFSPSSLRDKGTTPCIASRKSLIQTLKQSDLEIVWGVLGERHCWSSERAIHVVPKDAQFSGVFHLEKEVLVGGLTKHLIQKIPRH